MSGGATPSSTALRTRCGYCRMYSSAARVPYEPPQRLTCSAPRRARTASKSRTAIQVAYCRRSPRSSFRQAPSRSICCDCSNVALIDVSSTLHSSGCEPPVPRWSMNTMSRRALTSFSTASICRPVRVAAWPGPPARTNTGSGCLLRATAGTTAKRISMALPCGWSGSSGIDTVPQRTSRSTPGIRQPSSCATASLPPGRHAASAAAATAPTSRRRRIVRRWFFNGWTAQRLRCARGA